MVNSAGQTVNTQRATCARKVLAGTGEQDVPEFMVEIWQDMTVLFNSITEL